MASPHNPMMDENGRVWMTVQIRAGGKNFYPAWAKNTIATRRPMTRRRSISRTILLAQTR